MRHLNGILRPLRRRNRPDTVRSLIAGLSTLLWAALLTMALAPPGRADPCAAAGTQQLCVQLRSPMRDALVGDLTETLDEQACSAVKQRATSDGSLLLVTAVDRAALSAISDELARRRISFALLRGASVQHVDCASLLLPVASVERAMSTSPEGKPRRIATVSTARSAAVRRDRPAYQELPAMPRRYLSREEATPDVAILRERFTDLRDADQQAALNALSAIYDDWRLPEAQTFIEEVARGRLRFRVESKVRSRALALISRIDDG